MADRIPWEYFVLRKHVDINAISYFKGDTKEFACPQNADEIQVLNTFGQHGYELCYVQVTRNNDIKYYFKRPAKA